MCRNWRKVAVNCPELWRHFVDPHHTSSEWTQLVLERSKPHDITFYGTVTNHTIWEEEFVQEAKFADRLCSYSVAFDCIDEVVDNCEIWFSEELPLHWPKLKFLCVTHDLNYIPRSGFRAESDAPPRLMLPEDFPSLGSTPLLERLHFHRCFVEAPSQIIGLQALTELRVHHIRVFSASQWVNSVLLKLPNLKKAALDNAIVYPLDDSEGKEGWAAHLDLEEFCLKDHVSLCAELLRHVDVKTSRIFRLACYNIANPGEKAEAEEILSRISPTIEDLLHSKPFSERCALRLASSTVECFAAGYSGNLEWPAVSCSGETYDGSFVQIDFGAPPSLVQDTVVVLANMFRSVFFARVETLDIINNDGDTPLNNQYFLEMLWESSHRLRRIGGINMFTFKKIYRGMFPDHEEHGPGDLGQPGVPFLKALEKLEFWENDSDSEDDSEELDLWDYDSDLEDDPQDLDSRDHDSEDDPEELESRDHKSEDVPEENSEDVLEEYPLHKHIVEFCKRKKETGNPLSVVKDIPMQGYKVNASGTSDIFEQLAELGVKIVTTSY